MKGAGDTLQQFSVQGMPARSGQIVEQLLAQLPELLLAPAKSEAA